MFYITYTLPIVLFNTYIGKHVPTCYVKKSKILVYQFYQTAKRN